jgi:hypothetical protein
MSSQSIMSSKKASNNSGLCPVKGQKSSLGIQPGSQDYFSSLSLGITKTSIEGVMGTVSLQVVWLSCEPDTHPYLMLTLRVSEPTPLLHHMPTCYAQEQLYCHFYSILYEDIAFGTNWMSLPVLAMPVIWYSFAGYVVFTVVTVITVLSALLSHEG